MKPIILSVRWDRSNTNPEPLLTREWLVTNGLGGYASGTIGGAVTRRYHGLLIAALPTPLGRVLMLNHLFEQVRLPDRTTVLLGGEEISGGSPEIHGANYLNEFRLEEGLPVWQFVLGTTVLEKRILMPHTQNTVFVMYRVLEGDGLLRLKLRPSIHFRPHEGSVALPLDAPYVLTCVENLLEISAKSPYPPLRLMTYGERGTFTLEGKKLQNIFYRIEGGRGYESVGELWSPGYFALNLSTGAEATLVASTESWETIKALTPAAAQRAEHQRRTALLSIVPSAQREGVPGQLTLAADQFVILPAGRVEDAARARAAGGDVRTVIAGYHWFTDWGRDTMISLEGLTLSTGRKDEAGWILRTFAHYIRDGLLPNLFPEGEKEGLYHTVDATLWFFHALHRYVALTGDRETLRLILPKLLEIVEHHERGTRFGIRMDPSDSLLTQGQEGYQLTWMDAKVGDWVVTPRRGKAVEINALWYNALRLLEGWAKEELGDSPASNIRERANEVARSFNERFWYGEGGYLFDVIDGESGNDPACRPNQLLAISLDHPVLDPSRWKDVLGIVERNLLTPVGLRSLSPDHPDYKAQYYGDLRARDAAYHQGTVWAWLIGPFIDAWLKVHPGEYALARKYLEGFDQHLTEACVGSINEVFDATDPYTPRGCIAQAWSVAEVLRCWLKTEV